MNHQPTGPGPDPKVLRLIRKYDLEGAGDELEARWTHPENRTSLRALAESFNERILRAALDDADVETITDDVSRLYALLDGAEGSRGEQTAARRRLERAGSTPRRFERSSSPTARSDRISQVTGTRRFRNPTQTLESRSPERSRASDSERSP